MQRLVLAVLAVLAACSAQDPPGYENFPGLFNSYRLHEERVTWTTANRVCQLEGGHLLVVDSEDEAVISNLLFGRIGPYNPPLPWRYDLMHVGITDREEEGVWRTVLGAELSQSGYQQWRKGEPNNHRRSEDCGAIARNGKYSDLRCDDVDHRCPFVCEKEAGSSIENDIDIRENIVTTELNL